MDCAQANVVAEMFDMESLSGTEFNRFPNRKRGLAMRVQSHYYQG